MNAARSRGLTAGGDQSQLASLFSTLQPGDPDFNIVEPWRAYLGLRSRVCQCWSSLSRAASRSRLRCSRWRVGWVMVPSS
jgi:hypothetical protein